MYDELRTMCSKQMYFAMKSIKWNREKIQFTNPDLERGCHTAMETMREHHKNTNNQKTRLHPTKTWKQA